MTTAIQEAPATVVLPELPASRPPTCVTPWPLILLEGEEKSGRSMAAARLTASQHVGESFWLELGEVTADYYGQVPDARYRILEHDGTWKTMMSRVRETHTYAAATAAAQLPPTVLVIDTMTAMWALLCEFAEGLAAQRIERRTQGEVQLGPDEEKRVSIDCWNVAKARHRRLMTLLITFPGIVIMVARGKEVAEVNSSGEPTGRRTYRVEGERNLGYDASLWVRMYRNKPPQIIGMRHVEAGVLAGADKPITVSGRYLDAEDLIFERMGCSPASSVAPQLILPNGYEREPEPAGEQQLEQLFQLMGDAEISGRDAAQAFIATTLGPDTPYIHHPQHLNEQQADHLIDALNEKLDRQATRRRLAANGTDEETAGH